MNYGIRNGLEQAIDFLLAVFYFFIGLRIILKLISANAQTGFVQFINQVSEVLIRPFNNIFPSQNFNGGVLDISALAALIMYTLLAYIAISLVESFAQTHRGYFERYRY